MLRAYLYNSSQLHDQGTVIELYDDVRACETLYGRFGSMNNPVDDDGVRYLLLGMIREEMEDAIEAGHDGYIDLTKFPDETRVTMDMV